MQPIFVDWADFRIAHTAEYRSWPSAEYSQFFRWPTVGRLLPRLESGQTRQRKWSMAGLLGERAYWTPDEPVAFLSLPGQWWTDHAVRTGDAAGWDTIQDLAADDDTLYTLQRVDIAYHIPGADAVVCELPNVKITEFRVNQRLTGWTIGGSAGWLLRVYDKRAHDPGASCETRFPGILAELPWRVELQCRSKFLKSWKVGDRTGVHCDLWGTTGASAFLADFLREKSITILWRGEEVQIPDFATRWKRHPVLSNSQWEPLAKQARGCYIAAMMGLTGMVPPRGARRDVALDEFPGISQVFDAFEQELRDLVFNKEVV